ncbi:alginate lyase family protein [Halosimplex pelagicum]|uniref:Alginate lyase family protein n=1 Tax=Halosimplex pelagicum TaxID=869886 RepID=A0A7D5P6L4_9EURY|nr:alginate lyase family protein [Halosimplex pelagicum]QLH82023.1 alginate lyase family protein [Halosimplex pelagicum]
MTDEFLLADPDEVAAVRRAVRDGDDRFAPAVDALRERAEAALDAGPFSVVDKDDTPSSGDPRDYVSLSRYWWPNPDTDDGLPYVQRDGETNPEIEQFDRLPLGEMCDAVVDLSLGFAFLGDERYAERATTLLRTWFLDPDTGMNPHLQYAQHVPGRAEGRHGGINDTTGFIAVLDAIALLDEADSWTDEDRAELEAWFASFLKWLRESEMGRDEAAAENNHGTWYDAQIAAYALFAGEREVTETVVRAVLDRRIAAGIESDGRQPLELERTRPLHYATYNLRALAILALLGERVGVDLWHYETEDGRGIRVALDWLADQFIEGPTVDRSDEVDPLSTTGVFDLYRRAGRAYGDPRYERVVEPLDDFDPRSHRLGLLCPPPSFDP